MGSEKERVCAETAEVEMATIAEEAIATETLAAAGIAGEDTDTDEADKIVICLVAADPSPTALLEQLHEPISQLNELDFDLEGTTGVTREALQDKADELLAEVCAVIDVWLYARVCEARDLIEGVFEAHGVDAIVEFDAEDGAFELLFDFDNISTDEE